jgi:HD-like signal output (HDOD) protein
MCRSCFHGVIHRRATGETVSGNLAYDVVSLYPQPENARLLVVDDDPLVLAGLERALADESWEVVGSRAPQAALDELAGRPVDIVLADMHMDEMTGATLLGAVQQRHPDVVRIIMSGHTDTKEVLRSVPFAHQFLSKPLDRTVLKWTLLRACGLRRLLTNESIRAAVGATNEMPAAPNTYLRLKQLLRDPQASLMDVSGIIERDVGISARVMQLVSSAFFGAPRRVTSVSGAVGYLGVDTLRTLVLALEIVRMFRDAGNIRGFSLEALQRRSFVAAKLARGFAEDPYADDAYVAGMLHAVGQLILAERVPAVYTTVLERARTEPRTLSDIERAVLGATHAEVAAYLLGLWGLPQRIVEAVTYHEEPWRLDGTRLGLAGAVYLATVLAEKPDAPLCSGTLAIPPGHLNGDYLKRLGLLEKLPTLRSLARRVTF